MREEEARLLAREFNEVERGIFEAQPSSFEELNVQEVAREAGQPSRLLVHDLEVAPLFVRRELTLEEERCEPDDRRERSADLVRDHADQVSLVLLALAEAVVLL